MEAWDLDSFVKARYNLLGNAGHWFPGRNADCLDEEVTEDSLKNLLTRSPWRNEIPGLLRSLKNRVSSESQERLSKT